MPERSLDNEMILRYPTVYPGADLKVNPIAVSVEDGLVESVGTDGRFIGAIRPFPGMADRTIHGIPTPSGSTTVTSINNIIFAKYASIQRGTSRHSLKGIVYIADAPGGMGYAVYFAYRDSSDGSSDVVMLEDLTTWTDFRLTTLEEYDITSQGRYIYLVASGDTTSTVTSFDDKEAPYNKAYFWDFKINDWDSFTAGFKGRFMGILPQRLLSTPINEDGSPTSSSDSFESEVYSSSGNLSPAGVFTYGAMLVSRKHNLRSYLRLFSKDTNVNTPLRYRIDELIEPESYSSFVQQIRGNATSATFVIHWGISHYDGFKLYRTTVNDTDFLFGTYSPVNTLQLVDDYLEAGAINLSDYKIDHDGRATLFNDAKSTYYEDEGLTQQEQYDAFLDEFGPAPRFRRIAAYDGLLVGITDAKEPSTLSTTWTPSEQVPEAIAWSTLTHDEPENFPAANQYKPDDAAETFLSLVPVGDHLFAISNASIYRTSRSGSDLATNRLIYRLGGVSRFGQTCIGNSLFVVTAAGIKEIDGNTGEIRSLTNIDRIILDDSEWAGTLSSVFMEYDAKLGALVILNTSRHECYILWEATGAITKVEDCPWSFLTGGPDVLTDGPQRAYFITSTGTVHCIDGAREMGKRSMCGVTLSETVNGQVTTGSATHLIDSTATFPANCVGFKVYILSGDRLGESATITARNSATDLSITGLSGTLTIDDRYSVAPIVTRIVLPQATGQDGRSDPFVRKTMNSMFAAFSDLAGEYQGVNGTVRMGAKQGLTTITSSEVALDTVPDQCVVRVNAATTKLFPYLEFKGGNIDFELQAVLVKGILGISEAQSRQG